MLERVAYGVFRAADGVLHLAGGLLGLAFALQLGIAGDLAGGFLYCALGLIGGALHAILVQDDSTVLCRQGFQSHIPALGSEAS